MSFARSGLAGGFAASALAVGATGSNLTLVPTDATFIGWIGDSDSIASTSNVAAQYASASRLVANWSINGGSFSGGTILGQYATNVTNQTRIVIEGGVNDFRSAVLASTVIPLVLAFIAARRAEGKQVVINTVTPFKNAAGWNAAAQAEADTYNGAMLSRSAPPFVRVLNLLILADPADSQALNPAYDSGDHLHPNTTGGAAWAAALAVLSP